MPVTQDYFKRTLTRIDERDNLSKEQLFSFMSVLMNPQQDTVTSLLSEVQNDMFSERNTEMEQKDVSFDKSFASEPDNIEYQKLQTVELVMALEPILLRYKSRDLALPNPYSNNGNKTLEDYVIVSDIMRFITMN